MCTMEFGRDGSLDGGDWRRLIEHSADAIVVLDPNMRVTYVNPATGRMLGYSQAELLGRLGHDFVHPGDRDAMQAEFAVLLSEPAEHIGTLTGRIRHRDGSWRTIEAVGRRVPDGGSAGSVFFFNARDITDRQRAQPLLSDKEERFRKIFDECPVAMDVHQLFENATDVVCIIDIEGRYTWVNEAAERLTGYSRQELLGMRFTDLLAAPVPSASEPIAACIPGASSNPTEYLIRTRDGRVVPVEFSTNALYEDGKPIAIQGIGRDISAHKQAEDLLRKSHDGLRGLTTYLESAREQERTRIAREINDGLGQMLAVLKLDLENLIQVCRDSGATAPELMSRIDPMMAHLQSSLTSVKKICSDLRPGVLDHAGLSAAIEWQAGEFTRHTGILCSVEGMPYDLGVDPAQATGVFRTFQEILTNVMRHARAKSVRVRVRRGDASLSLEVEDDGVGISPGAVADLKSLGLLRMHERALSLGGTIRFTGLPGKGTTVCLDLPVKSGADPRPDPEPPAPAEFAPLAERTGLRLLIADGYAILRSGLKELLGEQFPGAEIAEAANGSEALALMLGENWDAVLLDISMPGKSGVAVLNALKRAGRKVPVLVLSTHTEEQYQTQVKQAGGSGYISKTSASSALLDALRRVLAGHTAFGSASPSVPLVVSPRPAGS